MSDDDIASVVKVDTAHRHDTATLVAVSSGIQTQP
jgi:hypothetical protein